MKNETHKDVWINHNATYEVVETPSPLESRYYPVRCLDCGWRGSSNGCGGGLPNGDAGDYDDLYCPRCESCEIEEA